MSSLISTVNQVHLSFFSSWLMLMRQETFLSLSRTVTSKIISLKHGEWNSGLCSFPNFQELILWWETEVFSLFPAVAWRKLYNFPEFQINKPNLFNLSADSLVHNQIYNLRRVLDVNYLVNESLSIIMIWKFKNVIYRVSNGGSGAKTKKLRTISTWNFREIWKQNGLWLVKEETPRLWSPDFSLIFSETFHSLMNSGFS